MGRLEHLAAVGLGHGGAQAAEMGRRSPRVNHSPAADSGSRNVAGVPSVSERFKTEAKGISDVLMRRLNDKLEVFYDAFRVRATYKYDEKAGVVVITVKDVKTGEIIRKIPPWKLNEFSTVDLKGLFLEKKA